MNTFWNLFIVLMSLCVLWRALNIEIARTMTIAEKWMRIRSRNSPTTRSAANTLNRSRTRRIGLILNRAAALASLAAMIWLFGLVLAIPASDPRAFPAKLAALVMTALSWPPRSPPAN